MSDLTWLIDPTTGALVVEGLTVEEASALAGDLLPPGNEINCARPLTSPSLPATTEWSAMILQVARIYHGSLVDGPGRRSVLQLQGCPIRCRGCYVPETHDPAGGTALGIETVVAALLGPAGAPRDGVTVLGGEPFFQPVGLAALLSELKAHGMHTLVYSGYTLETLTRQPGSAVRTALELTDLLIDGPFVAALPDDAPEWRGSHNQRLIPFPGRLLATHTSRLGMPHRQSA